MLDGASDREGDLLQKRDRWPHLAGAGQCAPSCRPVARPPKSDRARCQSAFLAPHGAPSLPPLPGLQRFATLGSAWTGLGVTIALRVGIQSLIDQSGSTTGPDSAGTVPRLRMRSSWKACRKLVERAPILSSASNASAHMGSRLAICTSSLLSPGQLHMPDVYRPSDRLHFSRTNASAGGSQSYGTE